MFVTRNHEQEGDGYAGATATKQLLLQKPTPVLQTGKSETL